MDDFEYTFAADVPCPVCRAKFAEMFLEIVHAHRSGYMHYPFNPTDVVVLGDRYRVTWRPEFHNIFHAHKLTSDTEFLREVAHMCGLGMNRLRGRRWTTYARCHLMR